MYGECGALERWGNCCEVLRGDNLALISVGQIISETSFAFPPMPHFPSAPMPSSSVAKIKFLFIGLCERSAICLHFNYFF